MRVSVIIPVYNEERCIDQCLKSLKNQQQKADEIIIIDNNCIDRTIEIAKKFDVKIVKEKKQGMIYARNRGFSEASYEIIARCDADNILPDDWIKKIKFNFSHNKIDALTGPIILYDIPFKTLLFANIYCFIMKLVFKGQEVLLGPNMIITKKIWNKIADKICLNDKFVHEDIDLTIHLIRVGGKTYYDSNLIVKSSGRRIKYNPLSFFVEYPIRLFNTFRVHLK